jgi:hypothetical protein
MSGEEPARVRVGGGAGGTSSARLKAGRSWRGGHARRGGRALGERVALANLSGAFIMLVAVAIGSSIVMTRLNFETR